MAAFMHISPELDDEALAACLEDLEDLPIDELLEGVEGEKEEAEMNAVYHFHSQIGNGMCYNTGSELSECETENTMNALEKCDDKNLNLLKKVSSDIRKSEMLSSIVKEWGSKEKCIEIKNCDLRNQYTMNWNSNKEEDEYNANKYSHTLNKCSNQLTFNSNKFQQEEDMCNSNRSLDLISMHVRAEKVEVPEVKISDNNMECSILKADLSDDVISDSFDRCTESNTSSFFWAKERIGKTNCELRNQQKLNCSKSKKEEGKYNANKSSLILNQYSSVNNTKSKESEVKIPDSDKKCSISNVDLLDGVIPDNPTIKPKEGTKSNSSSVFSDEEKCIEINNCDLRNQQILNPTKVQDKFNVNNSSLTLNKSLSVKNKTEVPEVKMPDGDEKCSISKVDLLDGVIPGRPTIKPERGIKSNTSSVFGKETVIISRSKAGVNEISPTYKSDNVSVSSISSHSTNVDSQIEEGVITEEVVEIKEGHHSPTELEKFTLSPFSQFSFSTFQNWEKKIDHMSKGSHGKKKKKKKKKKKRRKEVSANTDKDDTSFSSLESVVYASSENSISLSAEYGKTECKIYNQPLDNITKPYKKRRSSVSPITDRRRDRSLSPVKKHFYKKDVSPSYKRYPNAYTRDYRNRKKSRSPEFYRSSYRKFRSKSPRHRRSRSPQDWRRVRKLSRSPPSHRNIHVRDRFRSNSPQRNRKSVSPSCSRRFSKESRSPHRQTNNTPSPVRHSTFRRTMGTPARKNTQQRWKSLRHNVLSPEKHRDSPMEICPLTPDKKIWISGQTNANMDSVGQNQMSQYQCQQNTGYQHLQPQPHMEPHFYPHGQGPPSYPQQPCYPPPPQGQFGCQPLPPCEPPLSYPVPLPPPMVGNQFYGPPPPVLYSCPPGNVNVNVPPPPFHNNFQPWMDTHPPISHHCPVPQPCPPPVPQPCPPPVPQPCPPPVPQPCPPPVPQPCPPPVPQPCPPPVPQPCQPVPPSCPPVPQPPLPVSQPPLPVSQPPLPVSQPPPPVSQPPPPVSQPPPTVPQPLPKPYSIYQTTFNHLPPRLGFIPVKPLPPVQVLPRNKPSSLISRIQSNLKDLLAKQNCEIAGNGMTTPESKSIAEEKELVEHFAVEPKTSPESKVVPVRRPVVLRLLKKTARVSPTVLKNDERKKQVEESKSPKVLHMTENTKGGEVRILDMPESAHKMDVEKKAEENTLIMTCEVLKPSVDCAIVEGTLSFNDTTHKSKDNTKCKVVGYKNLESEIFKVNSDKKINNFPSDRGLVTLSDSPCRKSGETINLSDDEVFVIDCKKVASVVDVEDDRRRRLDLVEEKVRVPDTKVDTFAVSNLTSDKIENLLPRTLIREEISSSESAKDSGKISSQNSLLRAVDIKDDQSSVKLNRLLSDEKSVTHVVEEIEDLQTKVNRSALDDGPILTSDGKVFERCKDTPTELKVVKTIPRTSEDLLCKLSVKLDVREPPRKPFESGVIVPESSGYNAERGLSSINTEYKTVMRDESTDRLITVDKLNRIGVKNNSVTKNPKIVKLSRVPAAAVNISPVESKIEVGKVSLKSKRRAVKGQQSLLEKNSVLYAFHVYDKIENEINHTEFDDCFGTDSSFKIPSWKMNTYNRRSCLMSYEMSKEHLIRKLRKHPVLLQGNIKKMSQIVKNDEKLRSIPYVVLPRCAGPREHTKQLCQASQVEDKRNKIKRLRYCRKCMTRLNLPTRSISTQADSVDGQIKVECWTG